MSKLILLIIGASMCGCIPIPSEEPVASDRIDLLGLSGLFKKSQVLPILGTVAQIKKEIAYYPDFKQYGREEAVLEREHWISKIDSVYNKAQKKTADYLNLKPLVDTIQEHEKYGNDGEQHRVVAKALVNGFDALGNQVNAVVEVPFKANAHVMKTVNAALDAIGSKLVGI